VNDTTDLRPGYRISRLVKGGWQLAGGHGDIERDAALADMAAYLDAGITAFDCADIYTGVEALIGAFRTTLTPADRARLKVHTKFVPDLGELETIDKPRIRALLDRSRARLGQDRLDLVQFHWWDFTQPLWFDTAHHLADLQAEGVIDLLGGTNFDSVRTAMLLDAGVPLATMQVQYSLLDDRPAGQMAALCARSGMTLLCYGTVAGGFLSERWLGQPEPVGALENRSLVKYKLIIDDAGGWDWFQSLLRALATIGGRHGLGIGAVATRWALDQPHVAAAIVGVRSGAHLAQHRAVRDMTLDAADLAELATVLAQRSTLEGDVYELERDRDGRHGRIMKYNLTTETQGI
jgi:aryl-alcohol dehydrogenase-like predicted oxidoreductase